VFGNKEEKAAQDAAAKAEAERLTALPVPDLAEEIMAAFGPDGASPSGEGSGLNILQIGSFMMDSFPRGTKQLTALRQPLREGIQALENAGLLMQTTGTTGPGGHVTITRLGEQALAEGSVKSQVAGP